MRITYLGHASVLIEIDGVRIVTDPLFSDRLFHIRRIAPGPRSEHLTGVDLALVSHAHHDHLDPSSLRMLDGTPRVVCPAPVRTTAESAGLRTEVIGVGETITEGEVRVEAVHAEHEGRRMPWSRDGQAVGYVVRGPSGSAYFAGDTGVYPGMSGLAPVDLALLPVSGWGPKLPAGHMGPEEAVEAVELIEPRIAVPIHWGTYERIAMRSGHERERRARRFVDQVDALPAPVRGELLLPGSSIDL